MERRLERAATVVIRSRAGPAWVLAVKRPLTDEELPGLWGLPAASLRAGETMEQAARRIGPEKLGVPLRVIRELASGRLARQGYDLEMTLFEAEMDAREPTFPTPEVASGVTNYIDWRWVEPNSLKESARRGSLCSRLLLEWLGTTVNAPYLIARFHEVALKGKNRPFFIRTLVRNLEKVTVGVGVRWVRPGHMMVLMRLEESADWPLLRDRLATVFGANKYCPAHRLPPSLEEVKAFLARALPRREFGSFRITAHREDKTFPKTSQEIMRELGAYVQGLTGARVDLTHADLDIRVEVMPRDIYLYFEEWPGPGGLPVGVSGPVVGLLSGGIDSPVAAWYMMKRGCQVIFTHFHSFPLVDRSSIEKAVELAEMLTRYQYHSQLYLVPFAPVQKQILISIPPAQRVILYRRFMLRIAEALAGREGARALVTGDSLGQVSSQTLDNMATIQAAVSMPVLRPLIGMDKQEIMAQAQRLGTYAVSILPDQDCCSLFVPRHPALHASPEEVVELEGQLDVPGLVAEALAGAELREFTFPRAAGAGGTRQAVPGGSTQ